LREAISRNYQKQGEIADKSGFYLFLTGKNQGEKALKIARQK